MRPILAGKHGSQHGHHQVRIRQRIGSINNNDLGEEAGKMTGKAKEGGGGLMLTWLTVCGSVLDIEVRSDAHLRGG